jgi:hopanoid C-3 methylase
MKVLLVRPPVPPYTMGLKNIMVCEPLELEYVAAGLEGHEVQILDLILERGLERRLRQFKPDVVGTSCYITGVNEVKKVCRIVKRWNLACRTVVGGVHASKAPEDFADAAIDCIVLGDGTSIMPEIMQALDSGTSLEEIPGLAIPRGNVEIEFTGERPYMPKPDDLPFPRRDLVAHLKHRYYYLFHQPVATMKTTWGCWYKCNFCYTWRITDGMPFSRSPESIAQELAQIEAEEVYIVDDIFLINRQRLTKLAQILRARGIRKKYLVYGRADFIAENEDMIEEWAGLGLSAVLIGLEASTDHELESMSKECTVDFNRRAIEVLRRHGVDTYGSLIPQPDYMPDDWARLQKFIEDNGLYYLNISPLTPLPGTTIWNDYKDKLTVSRSAHGLWDLSHCLLPSKMPLKKYYRSLLGVYIRSILDIRRANRLTLRTRPSVWTPKYLRLWMGALKIMLQFLGAHRHHSPRHLKRAMDPGPEVPGLNQNRLTGSVRPSPNRSGERVQVL